MIRQLIAPLAIVAVVTFHAGQASAQGAFPAPLPGQVGTVNDPAFPPVNGAGRKVGTVNDPAFPPVNGAPATSYSNASAPRSLGNAPLPSSSFGNAPAPASFPAAGGASPFAAPPTQSGAVDNCMKEFMPMRAEAERRGKLLKAAGDRHAGPDEACKLMNSFVQAEVKMMKFVEANAVRCQIPPQIDQQLKTGHKRTEEMQTKICTAAANMKNQRPAGPSLSDVLGSATALPEATVAKKSGGTTFDTLSGNVLAR
ncbi:hypothetical protein [Bradyrhizobium sp.]|uniref:hypothetical protein n=1 Tax=Bradyrhizobium sp. TaxID=376 RepID=UPI00238410F0|nr:hypothetical protein [Bradyrhizobium sp.]MDE1934879.1 hypothetical protein [Bradyrhizobium sp.]MDE2061051.1 hypothetical protein [Bradyrhizobium sp.]